MLTENATAHSALKEYEFPKSSPVISTIPCEIVSTAAWVPEQVVTNEMLRAEYNQPISDKAIEATIGTVERRVAPKGEADTDLLVRAVKECLKKAGIEANQLSKIIVNKFLGDKVLPMTATFLQDKLGCSHAVHSFDIDGGINSFLQAFDMAQKLVNMGDGYILIASGGIINALTDKSNPRTIFTYGDGAAAVLIGPSKEKKFEASYFFSNYDFVDLYTGFSRLKKYSGHDFFERSTYAEVLSMYEAENWLPAKDFILEAMAHTSQELLAQAELSKDDIDLYIVTENNVKMWRSIVEHLDIPEEKCCSLIAKYGNTLSAMIPLMLNDAIESGKAKEGMRIMILSVGEGINGGGIIYKL